jgi:CHAD domain-containing protein
MSGTLSGHWGLLPAVAMSDIVKSFTDVFRIEFFDEQVTSTTLLDDFDHDLWHAGEILLLTSRNVLRLYGQGTVSEQPGISAKTRFWWDLPDSEIKTLLQKRIALRALMPVAELGVANQEFVLRNEDEKIVVRGEFAALTSNWSEGLGETAGANRVNSFVILRGLRGYDKEYEQAGQKIARLADRQLDSLSFKARIESLGFHVEKTPSDYGLSPDEPVEKAIREMSLLMLQQARANEQGVIDDIDTEFLHQFRVSLRKTRSLLNLMKKALPVELQVSLKSRLGELASSTNRLRDLDVFLLERNNYAAMLPDNFQEGVELLFKKIAADRERARKEVVSAFTSDKWQQLFASVFQQLEGEPLYATKLASRPIKQVADQKIHDRYATIREKGLRIDAQTPGEQVHDLRIEGKKLRYLMEFFAELYPAKTLKPLLKALKQLQTILGDFNDFEVQKKFLSNYEKSHRKSPELSAAINGLIAVLHQKQLSARAQVMQAFSDFNQEETVMAFYSLFQADDSEGQDQQAGQESA